MEDDDDIQDALTEAVGDTLTQSDSEGLTEYLYQQGVISQREMLLFNSMLKDRVLTGLEKRTARYGAGFDDAALASHVEHDAPYLATLR